MSDSDFPWPLAIVAVGTVIAGCSLVSVLVWQGFSTWRVRLAHGKADEYRQVAQETASAMRDVSAQLNALTDEVRLLRERTTEVERVLKEV